MVPARPWSTSFVAGGVVSAIGAIVLAGWVFDAGALTSASRSLPAIHPSAALALFLMGGALVLLALAPAPTWSCVLRRLAAALALAVALLPLADYALDLRGDIHHAIVHDLVTAGGRLPPVTALGLVTSAVAFLLLDAGHAGAIAQILALAGGISGLSGYSAAAVQTSVALVL